MGLSTNLVYKIALVATALCACGWVIQLGGLASLQQNCPTDHHLADNNILPIQDFLMDSKISLMKIAQMPDVDPNGNPNAAKMQMMSGLIAKSFPQLLGSIKTLTSRSTSQFTMTADTSCSPYYRYFWVNCGLQAVALIAVAMCLVKKLHVHARISMASWLVVASVLAIENIHTSYYMYSSHQELLPTAAYVFLSGCVITAVFNLVLVSALGWDASAPAQQQDADFSQQLPVVVTLSATNNGAAIYK